MTVRPLLFIVLPAFSDQGNILPPAASWSPRWMLKRHLRHRAEDLQ